MLSRRAHFKENNDFPTRCARAGPMVIFGLSMPQERILRLTRFTGKSWIRGFFGAVKDETAEDVWTKRLALLDEPTREAMVPFVERKLVESETRELAWEPDE